MPRTGIVTVAGKPNAGKSTLLNCIIGQKLAITSPKPQSTRDRVTGIYSRDDLQIVFSDTPGLLDPEYALQRSMRATALEALRDADVVLHVVDATGPLEGTLQDAAGLATAPAGPIVTALNKVDLLGPEQRRRALEALPGAIPVSATTGEGLDALLEAIAERLPEGPFLYDPDDVSTQNLRFFVAELVRETALEQLEQEVPYSIACQVEEFREDRKPVYIRAVVYVERESQKGIVIGQKGARLRDIGRAARQKIEAFLGEPVYLDLWVKVLANWRRDRDALRRLGYHVPEDPRR